jgi:hypothetical protein
MKSAPAVSVTLQPSPGWQRLMSWAAWAAPACVAGGVVWHGVAGSPALQALPIRLMVLVALIAAGLLGVAIGRLRTPRLRRLSWDGQQWWGDLRPEAAATATLLPDAALPGEVSLQIDWGGWMLLRFVPHAADGHALHRSTCWIALGEAPHRPHWHALRCALCDPGAPGTATAPTP